MNIFKKSVPHEKPARAKWTSKTAFILAGAASAVGLGNIWRFPYLAAKFGGGTFLITYLILVLTVGISLLLLETSLGRLTKKSAVNAFQHFGKKFTIIGILAAVVPFIITPYYCVIGGWVTRYLFSYVTDAPANIAASDGSYFVNFVYGDYSTYFWMLLFMAIVFIVVALGVNGGIEKCNLVLMPALILLVVGLGIYTMCQPGALEGVAYYLIPDFSKFNSDLLVNALGQMFYSLSLAMGIMITYGSYLGKQDRLTSSVASIGGFDFGVSLFAGLLIVPAAFVALGSPEAVAAKAGPSLMFITLPSVFEGMGAAANVVGVLFFLLVLFAALTSAISLTETCVSIVYDVFHVGRRKAVIIAIIIIVLLGVFVNLGYNAWGDLRIGGMEVLDFFDFVSNSVLMPIVALVTCVVIGWIVKPAVLIEEIEQGGKPFTLKTVWTIIIKFIAPIVCIVVLLSQVIPVLFG